MIMLSTLCTLNLILAREYECPKPNCATPEDLAVNPFTKLWK